MVLAALSLLLVGPPQALARPEITFRGLGGFDGQLFESKAYAVSGDGKIVVGSSNAKFGEEGFVWTEKDGMKSIGVLHFPLHVSRATSISADGSVVAGLSLDEHGKVAITWTKDGGLISLGRVPGTTTSAANGISDGGKVVVGDAGIAPTKVAYDYNEYTFDGYGRLQAMPSVRGMNCLLANQCGFVCTGGAYPVSFESDVPRLEFFINGDSLVSTSLSYVEYRLSGAGIAARDYLEGPISQIGRRSLVNLTLKGVSKSGGVLCGTISSSHEWFDDAGLTEELRISAFSSTGSDILRLRGATEGNAAHTKEAPGTYATAVSANGSTVVGYYVGLLHGDIRFYPMMWTADGTIHRWIMAAEDDEAKEAIDSGLGGGALERLRQEEMYSRKVRPLALSADGRVIGGELVGGNGVEEPFLWTREAGFFFLGEYLRRYCPEDFKGWAVSSLRGISADGRIVVGYGRNPKGRTEAFIATIGNIRRPFSELFSKKPVPGDDDSDGD